MHKEVARNAPALHAGPPRFFTLKGSNVLAQKKLSKKMLYHMVASRCKNHFSLLANGYRDLNKVIEQLVIFAHVEFLRSFRGVQ